MRRHSHFPLVLWGILAMLIGVSACSPSLRKSTGDQPAISLPWDMDRLSHPPGFEWAAADSGVLSLYYQGEPYQGKATRVFAYYATPGTLRGDRSIDRRLPAVVLVHGGGGHAFRNWAEMWARRGYAAIAMDLVGCGPNGERLSDGGPGQGHTEIFVGADTAPKEMWSYQAVAAVIRAHSLIRSFPEVDPGRTAITGISWGGYLTCIVSGLDHRFKAAVPVYGCGFLADDSAWTEAFAQMTPENRKCWIARFDPSSAIGGASTPMFFINGTNDFAYPLGSYARTCRLVRSPKNYRITVGMQHSHEFGWEPPEIERFIGSRLRGETPLPVIGTPTLSDGRARAKVKSETRIVEAGFHFTTDTGTVNKRTWLTRPAAVEGTTISADAPPPGTTMWFLTVRDDHGSVVSTEPMIIER